MRQLGNYECASLTNVAVARNVFLPQLNPFNYEVGVFGIDFRYKPCKGSEIEAICHSNIRVWKDFLHIFPQIVGEKETLEFLKEKIGIQCSRNNETNVQSLILKMQENLESNMPLIVYCNPYHLEYTDYYQTEPGGAFRTYHQIVVFGISRWEDKVWIYDPTLTNYYGVISLKDFSSAIEDGNGIENFEGPVYTTLDYDGKKFSDMNRELLMDSLDYYFNSKDAQIQQKVLAFFHDFTNLYHGFPNDDYRNKLLEFGFFVFRRFGTKRLHWWDFLEYYRNIKEINHISEENAAFKAHIDRLFAIPNILYTNSLKKKKKLNLERLGIKLERLLEEEKSIFRSLNAKLKKG